MYFDIVMISELQWVSYFTYEYSVRTQKYQALLESTEIQMMIKFCVNLGKTDSQTIKSKITVGMNVKERDPLVSKWHKCFRQEWETRFDNKGRGS